MILPKPEDAFHKVQLLRLLMAILDSKELAQNLYFKGGSCALLLGWLDRFSLDLDFEINPKADKKLIKKKLLEIFKTLNLKIKSQTKKTLLFILRYQAKVGLRNSLKLGIVDLSAQANEQQPFYLAEIDRYAICQTRETMVANKLVAPLDRWEKYQTIAGRDIYDLHYFLSHGYGYKKEIVEERRKAPVGEYLKELKNFIENRVTLKIISQDLSYLLPYEKFRSLRKTLKTETLFLLEEEIKKL